MIYLRRSLRGVAIALLSALALCACGRGAPTVVPTAPDTASLLTATPVTPTVNPTPIPTEASHNYVNLYHSSGVFSIAVPDDWEISDDSTDQRLLVRLIPPIGFGSRVTVDVTNEGTLVQEDVSILAESYIRLRYTNQGTYTEVNRSDLADGRLQVVFLYDDGTGATGRETLYIQQIGPYFTALRVFLSDADSFHLSSALETMVSSFQVDATAVWGEGVAAINPAELLLVNTTVWQNRAGQTYYMGDLYNASPADIMHVQIRAAFCDASGIVLTEVTHDVAVKRIAQGSQIPFAVVVEGMPRDVTVCAKEASAQPAQTDPAYTTSFVLEPSTELGRYRQLVMKVRITNPNLVAANNVEIIFAVYDAEGRVIGYKLLKLSGRLEPGQSETVEYTFEELAGEAHHAATIVQGNLINVSDPSLAPTSGP